LPALGGIRKPVSLTGWAGIFLQGREGRKLAKKNALLEMMQSNLSKGEALDASKLIGLTEAERLIVKIIGEETEKERERQKKGNALLKALGNDAAYEDDLQRASAYADSLRWDELLTHPRVVTACSARAGLFKSSLLEFVHIKCNPKNWDGVFWMSAWYTELEKNEFNNDSEKIRAEEASKRALAAAQARHGKAGGSWELARKIREAWASGKFSSRAACAEQEWEAIGFATMQTARDKLQGMPDPDPWPGKKKNAQKPKR
jgi:hypothetical protein